MDYGLLLDPRSTVQKYLLCVNFIYTTYPRSFSDLR